MDIDSHTNHLVTGWNPMTLEQINEEHPKGPRLMSSAAFITGFMPPDYLIDGILQRRFIYAFTGRTGEGKTSVCLRLAAHVAQGTQLGDAAVTQGRVLYLAGENPDDIRMRWILLLEQMWLDENEVAVDFVDGRLKSRKFPSTSSPLPPCMNTCSSLSTRASPSRKASMRTTM
jgi:hypothetical protein